jgi:hypothetical protein
VRYQRSTDGLSTRALTVNYRLQPDEGQTTRALPSAISKSISKRHPPQTAGRGPGLSRSTGMDGNLAAPTSDIPQNPRSQTYGGLMSERAKPRPEGAKPSDQDLYEECRRGEFNPKYTRPLERRAASGPMRDGGERSTF